MEAEYTKIDNDLAVKARFLYNEQIDDWWEKIAQITGKTFSDNAEVIFDMSVISD